MLVNTQSRGLLRLVQLIPSILQVRGARLVAGDDLIVLLLAANVAAVRDHYHLKVDRDAKPRFENVDCSFAEPARLVVNYDLVDALLVLLLDEEGKDLARGRDALVDELDLDVLAVRELL